MAGKSKALPIEATTGSPKLATQHVFGETEQGLDLIKTIHGHFPHNPCSEIDPAKTNRDQIQDNPNCFHINEQITQHERETTQAKN